MKTAFILAIGFLLNCVQCYATESFEWNTNNGLEFSPLYEPMIFSDIADILKEFDNNNVANDDDYVDNTESDEDVEDLLSQYHHYLEKAHKQSVNYLEKNKLKNKVPIIRHETFTKLNGPMESKQNDFYKNFFKPGPKFPFNMFIPFDSNKLITSEKPAYNNDLTKNIMFFDQEPMMPFVRFTDKASKDGHPGCKYCSPFVDPPLRTSPNVMLTADDGISTNSMFPDPSEDTINLRVKVKVDIQLPKLQTDKLQFYNPQSKPKMTDIDTGLSKEYFSAIKIPSPSFDFPIPLNLFGHNKMLSASKHDTFSPFHKITIHNKKKKSKAGSTNKKHRKKVITIHNFKIEPELSFSMYNMSFKPNNKTGSNNNTVTLHLNSNNTHKENVLLNLSTTSAPAISYNKNEAQAEENILLFVNITNNIDNGTNNNHTTENSIETEYSNIKANLTTNKPLHLIRKREISSDHKTSSHKDVTHKSNVHKDKSSTHKLTAKEKSFKAGTSAKLSAAKSALIKNKNQKKITKKPIVAKKKPSPKSLAHKTGYTSQVKPDKGKSHKKPEGNSSKDLELLFWPNINSSKSKDIMKDITAIILENENKKAKLNMSSAAIHHNRTKALEQAIFGNIDWNDVDRVAPAFISFVGKYTEGIITFCNEHICHSMKCSKQSCLHRYCAPKDRYNQGHCTGSNYTDSVASMESINDLPSNVAFEIVDILQDRMIGKLFGKITLCISSKCITFAASKKDFHKYKCVSTDNKKGLDAKGHCKQV